MKKYLLGKKANFYKANLHCHSTCSDGTFTPEELKKLYMDKGYSVIAFTDHQKFFNHNDLTDQTFLALNGCELHFRTEDPNVNVAYAKCCHINLISKTPEVTEGEYDYSIKYTPGNIKKTVNQAKNDFLVAYNHPTWSMEAYEDYKNYGDFYAMEIHNTNAITRAIDEFNIQGYDSLLKAGKHVFALATDDNHNFHPLSSVLCDSFGGFVMINADKLEYSTIIKALENGKFYSSQGPEINELYYEDGKVYVKCSKAKKIKLNTDSRRYGMLCAEGNETLTEAVFNIAENDLYFRITVTDQNGNSAFTNGYFLSDIK